MKTEKLNWSTGAHVVHLILMILVIGGAIKVFFTAASLAWSAHSLLSSVPAEWRDFLVKAYWLVSVYGFVLAICSLILIVSTFALLKSRRNFYVTRAIGVIVMAVCAGHIVYALVGDATTELAKAVMSFSDVLTWLPTLMIFTIVCFELVVYLTSRADIAEKN